MKTLTLYKSMCTITLISTSLLLNAQVKVTSAGRMGVGITGSTNPTTPELRTHIIGTNGIPATSGTTQTGILRLQGVSSNTSLDFGCNYGATSVHLRGAYLQATNRSDLSFNYTIALNPNGGNVIIGSVVSQSKLGVAGNVAIGSTYSTNSAAPTDGAIIQGNVGIGTTSPGAYRLYVNGNSYFNGSGTYTGSWTSSDQQLKTNIDTIANVSEIISQLKPRTYFYDTANVYGLNFSNKRQYGFIAQELEEVLPELVKSEFKEQDVDTSGNIIHPPLAFKSVNYPELIAVLTKALQEQQKQIETIKEDLQAKTTELNDRLNSCCTVGENRSTLSNSSNTNQTDIKLTDAQSIVLEQNVPNPFAEQTSISYYLPDNTKKAQMLFYNAQGRLIQSTDLVQKGKGVVNVFASDLSNGIYTYTLVVDGKIIETKKMVKQ